jgi:hypothetical protein
MTAEMRASELMGTVIKDVPDLARQYLRKLCCEVGMCGEVMFHAYAVYAQCVENLVCEDSPYQATDEEKKWFIDNAK